MFQYLYNNIIYWYFCHLTPKKYIPLHTYIMHAQAYVHIHIDPHRVEPAQKNPKSFRPKTTQTFITHATCGRARGLWCCAMLCDVVWCFATAMFLFLSPICWVRPSALSWTSACCRHGSQRKQRFGTNPLGSCRPWPFPIWPCLLWFCPKWPTSPRISAGFNIVLSYFSCCSSAGRLVLYLLFVFGSTCI